MFLKDPSERPSASEALEHRWFQQDEAILKELLNLNKKCARATLLPQDPALEEAHAIIILTRTAQSTQNRLYLDHYFWVIATST
jgi:hypothetical protein